MGDRDQGVRHSNVVYVLIQLPTANGPSLLLRRHEKWGDWSLVGGHVEKDEIDDWLRAAAREATEELEPLVSGQDFVIEPVTTGGRITWGPEPSRSAQGQRTIYHIEYYTLKFLHDPVELLRRLPAAEFRLVSERELESTDDVFGKPVRQAQEFLYGHPDAVRPAWDMVLDLQALPPNMQPSRRALNEHG